MTSNSAQVTFLFPLFLQSLLGLRMKASEARCDQPSCLCPFLTYQRKNSSQAVRESSEPGGRPTTPPNLLKSLILVRCEKLRCLFQRSPAPHLREKGQGQRLRDGIRQTQHSLPFPWLAPSSCSRISLLGPPGFSVISSLGLRFCSLKTDFTSSHRLSELPVPPLPP